MAEIASVETPTSWWDIVESRTMKVERGTHKMKQSSRNSGPVLAFKQRWSQRAESAPVQWKMKNSTHHKVNSATGSFNGNKRKRCSVMQGILLGCSMLLVNHIRLLEPRGRAIFDSQSHVSLASSFLLGQHVAQHCSV